jgi:hypothetical protein
MAQTKPRKPYAERALVTRTTSRRFRAGTRRNKKLCDVGTFASDRRAAS